MTHVTKMAGFALVTVLTLGGFGCAPKSVKIGDDVLPTGKTTYTDDQGNSGTVELRGEGEAPPEGFPKEFPIMPGFKVLNYAAMNQDGGSISSGEWTSSKSVGDIFGYYKDALPKAGFTISSTGNYGDTSTLGFSRKGDQRYSGVMTMEKQSDGSTTTSMSYFFVKDVQAQY